MRSLSISNIALLGLCLGLTALPRSALGRHIVDDDNNNIYYDDRRADNYYYDDGLNNNNDDQWFAEEKAKKRREFLAELDRLDAARGPREGSIDLSLLRSSQG